MGISTNPAIDINQSNVDIIPRVATYIFDKIEKLNLDIPSTETKVKISFLEIHNEEIKDLLIPKSDNKSIVIRENASGDIILIGIHEHEVNNADEMLLSMCEGAAFRSTGSTLMNSSSSRSHAIFTIIIEQKIELWVNGEISGHEYVTAKFHLVDLAGSERAKRTGAVGARFKESVTINRGLLGICIIFLT